MASGALPALKAFVKSVRTSLETWTATVIPFALANWAAYASRTVLCTVSHQMTRSTPASRTGAAVGAAAVGALGAPAVAAEPGATEPGAVAPDAVAPDAVAPFVRGEPTQALTRSTAAPTQAVPNARCCMGPPFEPAISW